jgi:hypothetical protein
MTTKEQAVIELTPGQRRELQGGAVPRLVDPDTHQTYVLVSEKVYERVKSLFGDAFHPSDAYPAINRAFAEGWNDPKMDDYDRYEELKP